MADLAFLSTIPIFGFFTREELEAAEKRFEEILYPKDAVVTRIGEPGEVFYVILDGELEVWDGNDPPNRTGTLSKGDFFGEMALLQGGKRTATVTVSRRARLLSVNKDAFEELFLRNPKAIEYFARVLSKRLAGLTRGDRGRRSTTTISVASKHGRKGETALSLSLGAVLRDLTGASVLCVEVRPGTERPSASVANSVGRFQAVPTRSLCSATRAAGDASGHSAAGADGARGPALEPVSKLSDSFNFIIFDSDPTPRPHRIGRRILRRLCRHRRRTRRRLGRRGEKAPRC